MSRLIGLGPFVLFLAACGGHQPDPAPVAAPIPAQPPETVVVRDTVKVRDAELEQQVARLEIRVLERDARIEELQNQLEGAQQEVVRALAKSQNASSRAEAASAIAEAELAMQSPRGTSSSDVAQARRLLQKGSEAFNQLNYSGALYLANQAKGLVSGGRAPVPGGDKAARPGEKTFASPVRLRVLSRANAREGPGPNFKVVFALSGGVSVTGYSYTDQWMRVSDDEGRTGWVSRRLLGPRK